MSKTRKVVFIIGITVVVIAIVVLVLHFTGRAKRNKVYDDIKPTQQAEIVETEPAKTNPINFLDLAKINEDIYAWINIPDTTIDYPIVQGGPFEDYYLDHTIEHAEGFPGSIYTQKLNTKTFEDYNTVIYGHELADNTMFTPLHNYMDPDFFSTHREIKIYTPVKEITYKVFAAITYDDRLILDSFDMSNEYDRKMFLESVYGNRVMNDNFADDITVTENDKIITLSTCLYDLPSNRYLVLAVKTGEEMFAQ